MPKSTTADNSAKTPETPEKAESDKNPHVDIARGVVEPPTDALPQLQTRIVLYAILIAIGSYIAILILSPMMKSFRTDPIAMLLVLMLNVIILLGVILYQLRRIYQCVKPPE